MEQYGAIRTVLTPYSSVLFYLFVGAQMQVYRPYRSPCQKCTDSCSFSMTVASGSNETCAMECQCRIRG